MANTQGPSKSGRNAANRARKNNSPLSPGFDKKLDGPNRPST
ncbi:spore protein [Cohnella cholangitidis]|nr:spore protein [Cohnella cholangitidis]